MPTYQLSDSPVFRALFQPVLDVFPSSPSQYICHQLADLDFIEAGVQRCLSSSLTGRDFIQFHTDNGRTGCSVDLHFKALKSKRRLTNLKFVNEAMASPMKSNCEDPFESIPELKGFAIYGGDGHYHGPAVHDVTELDRSGNPRKEAVGHFFLLDLRTHFLCPLAKADQSGTRKREHDMRAMKRVSLDQLRCGEPNGTKVILAWDRAGIDFTFWHKAKMSSGLYFISREKSNMKLTKCGNRDFDKDDSRNTGVISDENVGPGGSGGTMFRRITYQDPIEKTTYVYLTTEMTLPPGVLALIYKHRWDIEKVFDELKNKLQEKKAWASSETAKTMQAYFLCLTHNLMVMVEVKLKSEDGIENTAEKSRKESRAADARKKGATEFMLQIQRFTVRSVKFVRWLRNHVYRKVAWSAAVSRLQAMYAIL